MGSDLKSGRLRLTGDEICYTSGDYGTWSFPAKDLRVLGEYTNDQGPFLDDWFMVFVTTGKDGWYEASSYSDGIEEFLTQLTAHLKTHPLRCELAASADYASRILWPGPLNGQPLFEFDGIALPWWRRWLRAERCRIQIRIRPEVQEYASGRSGNATETVS